MNIREHQGSLSQAHIRKYFPYDTVRGNQEIIIPFVAEYARCLIEAPTGTGKTALEYAILRAAQSIGIGPLYLITPNKAVLETLHRQIMEADPKAAVTVALGKNEYPCYFFEEDKKTLGEVGRKYKFTADQTPTTICYSCPHYVNRETGETLEQGAKPCPYYTVRYEAEHTKGIVLCTMSFYLFTHLFKREEIEGVLVIDEVHQLPRVVRNSLSCEITDYHLRKAVDLLVRVEAAEEAAGVETFLKKMIHIAKRRPALTRENLKDHEIEELLEILEKIDKPKLLQTLQVAVEDGEIDVEEELDTLKSVETFARDLYRYVNAFAYSLPNEKGERPALNYIYAFYKTEPDEGEKANYRLVVKCYSVGALIRRMLAPMTYGFSATIGDRKIFGFESGMREKEFPFISVPSDFPPEHTAIFMPTNTPNLAQKFRPKGEPTRVLRRIAKAAHFFADKGIRSLLVVVSNAEREKFLMLAEEEKVEAVSYGNGVSAKDAARRFADGEGKILVGTEAIYSEGINLPKEIAPVIFALRPSYTPPNDPQIQFERRRFGENTTWSLQQYRAANAALQIRGRNVRSNTDLGVCFYISEQWRRIVRAALPESLRLSYYNDLTFEEGMEKAVEIVGK